MQHFVNLGAVSPWGGGVVWARTDGCKFLYRNRMSNASAQRCQRAYEVGVCMRMAVRENPNWEIDDLENTETKTVLHSSSRQGVLIPLWCRGWVVVAISISGIVLGTMFSFTNALDSASPVLEI